MLNVNQIDVHEPNAAAGTDPSLSNASTQLNTPVLAEEGKAHAAPGTDDSRVPPRHVKLSLTDLSKVRSVEELGRDDISKTS